MNVNLLNKLKTRSPKATISGGLANLWRRVLTDLDATKKLTSFLASYSKRYKNDSEGVINASTIKTNSYADEISLSTLITLLSKLLNIKKISITITLTHRSGTKTQHSETIYDETIKDKHDE